MFSVCGRRGGYITSSKRSQWLFQFGSWSSSARSSSPLVPHTDTLVSEVGGSDSIGFLRSGYAREHVTVFTVTVPYLWKYQEYEREGWLTKIFKDFSTSCPPLFDRHRRADKWICTDMQYGHIFLILSVSFSFFFFVVYLTILSVSGLHCVGE
jgi:hypothetical protein